MMMMVVSGGLDLFLGLMLNEMLFMVMNVMMIFLTVDASSKSTTLIFSVDLFGFNNVLMFDSLWRCEKFRIGYGCCEVGVGLMDFEVMMMVKVEVFIEDVFVFDEVEVGGDDAFEFVVVMLSEEDELVIFIVGDDRGDVCVEFCGLLKVLDVRFKLVKLAYESVEARRVVVILKWLVFVKECIKLLEIIEKFKFE